MIGRYTTVLIWNYYPGKHLKDSTHRLPVFLYPSSPTLLLSTEIWMRFRAKRHARRS